MVDNDDSRPVAAADLMQTGVEIRAATAADAVQLARIEQRCFDPAIYGHILLSESEFRRMIGRSRVQVIVAAKADHVIGYAAVFYLRAKRLTWFYSHAVDREYRGLGAGTRLFRRAEQLAVANACPCMILEIRGKQELFRRYTRDGYQIVREIPGFYPDGSTAIRMGKLLTAGDAAFPAPASAQELAAV